MRLSRRSVKVRALSLLLAASTSLTGCSLFVSGTQSVAISATDPTAEIFVDGQPAGKTPITTSLKRNKSHAVIARAGDRTGTAVIDTEISTTGVLDIVGGVLILIPLIGLAGPGFWSLDPTTLVVYVPPPAGAPAAASTAPAQTVPQGTSGGTASSQPAAPGATP